MILQVESLDPLVQRAIAAASVVPDLRGKNVLLNIYSDDMFPIRLFGT